MGAALVMWRCEAKAQPIAEGSAGNRTAVYADSDETIIITNATEAGARFDAKWQVGAHYLVDIVSSASVDVVTQATAKMDDVRHEAGGSA